MNIIANVGGIPAQGGVALQLLQFSIKYNALFILFSLYKTVTTVTEDGSCISSRPRHQFEKEFA